VVVEELVDVLVVEVLDELLVVELVLVDELVDVLVELLVGTVEVVVAVQSWKQQEHAVETTPPICVQVLSVLTVAHCGGFANWHVTPLLPQAVAASQLSSSDLHADVIVRSLWATHFWNLPWLLFVQVSPLQHCDWMVL
jgi:hypothetical protein